MSSIDLSSPEKRPCDSIFLGNWCREVVCAKGADFTLELDGPSKVSDEGIPAWRRLGNHGDAPTSGVVNGAKGAVRVDVQVRSVGRWRRRAKKRES